MSEPGNEKRSELEIVKTAQQGDKAAEEFLLEKYRKNVLIPGPILLSGGGR
jgi:hypothetical protein